MKDTLTSLLHYSETSEDGHTPDDSPPQTQHFGTNSVKGNNLGDIVFSRPVTVKVDAALMSVCLV